jgi:hypothetical protein
MIRVLSNKDVPVPLIEEIAIDLLQSLKDFRNCARKQAAAVNLHKIRTNTLQPQGQPMQRTTTSDSLTTSNDDLWHEPTNNPMMMNNNTA